MAERSLNSILTDINTQIKTVSFGSKITTWGLCYQQEKNEKTFPILNQGNKNGQKIHWDDTYPLQTYHRIIAPMEKETDLSQGFGTNFAQRRIYNMRLVGIGTKRLLSSANYEDNQEIAKAVCDVLPHFVDSAGLEYFEIGEVEVTKPVVYEEEFPGIELKKLSLEGIAFWIDYTLRIKIC